MSNKGDQVTFPASAEIIHAREGCVHLLVETVAAAEECRERYFDRWDPRGYGAKARIKPGELPGGEGFVLILSRHKHCD